jgi:ABC-type branched-subunit amino acid transport system ATPase component
MILGLAKCVLQDCQLLLLDEPSTGLSVVHRNEVFSYLRVLAEHRAILMVEQSMSAAFVHSDLVYQIRKRAGQGPEEASACVRVNADAKASIAASYRAGRAAEASDAVAALLGGAS